MSHVFSLIFAACQSSNATRHLHDNLACSTSSFQKSLALWMCSFLLLPNICSFNATRHLHDDLSCSTSSFQKSLALWMCSFLLLPNTCSCIFENNTAGKNNRDEHNWNMQFHVSLSTWETPVTVITEVSKRHDKWWFWMLNVREHSDVLATDMKVVKCKFSHSCVQQNALS